MLTILALFLLLTNGITSQILDTGRFYRIFRNRNVETNPNIANLGNFNIFDSDQYLSNDPILIDKVLSFVKNLTISGNTTTENFQIFRPPGAFDLEFNQKRRNPLRSLFDYFVGNDYSSNIPTIIVGGGRSMYDQNNQWFRPSVQPVQLARRRLAARKPHQKRLILVRNLTPTQLRNLQRVNVPVYEDTWKIEPTWLEGV